MRKILLLLLTIFICVQLSAQESGEEQKPLITPTQVGVIRIQNRPAQISLFYPLGTSGKMSKYHCYNLSLNILYGRTGGINGLELSGLAGLSQGNVRGLQLSGIASLGKNVTGVQLSGLIGGANDITGLQLNGLVGMANNTNGIQFNGLVGMANDLKGFQITGLVGLTNNTKGAHINGGIGIANNLKGLQFSGLASMANNTKGMQIGGLITVANNLKGAQFTGGLGVTNDMKGLQFSGLISTANHVRGAQITGVLNRTHKLSGFQFALLNITDTVAKGVPMGFISVVKNGGYSKFEAFSSDIVNVGISYKLGIRRFYSIYSVGYNFFEDQLFAAGFGWGSNMRLDKNDKYQFQPEVINYTYFPTDFKNIRFTNATQLRVGFVRNFGKFGVYVAPSVYVATSHKKDGEFGYKISPIETVYKNDGSSNRTTIGVGYTVGITF